jgi:serine/threonine protein kinase
MDETPLSVQDILYIEGDLDLRLDPSHDWDSYYCHLDNAKLTVFQNLIMDVAIKCVMIGPSIRIQTDGTPNALFFDIYDGDSFVLGVCAADPPTSRRWIETIRTISIPQPRMSIDCFHVVRVLGRGSLGKIVLAENLESKELFAIKSIPKGNLAGSDSRKSAVAERNLLMCIKHPFIVQLKFAFQTSKKFYLGLEYVPGGKLSRFMEHMGRISNMNARLCVAEITLALMHLHSIGVLYRDLTPDHVLIDEEGHVRLTGFALAKAFSQSSSRSTSSFCGNQRYLAPEMFMGSGYSVGIDWWALGIILCEMVTGMHPFAAPTEPQMINGIMMEDPNIPPFVDKKIASVIRGLLKKNPDERMGSDELTASPLFAGFDWDYVSEKRYQAKWGTVPDGLDAPVEDETALESLDSPGKDSMRIEGFSYVSPFEDDHTGQTVVLDLALMEEYENMAHDLQ